MGTPVRIWRDIRKGVEPRLGKDHTGGERLRSERMATKRSKVLVSYDGLPTVVRNFFEIVPETEVSGPPKRVKKRKGV